MDRAPELSQVNLVVADIEASLAFYRLLGLPFHEPAGLHAWYEFGNGMRLELDQFEFAGLWNSGTAAVVGGTAVFTVRVDERQQVDDLWQRMVDAGYPSRQRPYDAFWGSRYAIVADPDGYQVGLMSVSMEEHRFWPPTQAPG